MAIQHRGNRRLTADCADRADKGIERWSSRLQAAPDRLKPERPTGSLFRIDLNGMRHEVPGSPAALFKFRDAKPEEIDPRDRQAIASAESLLSVKLTPQTLK